MQSSNAIFSKRDVNIPVDLVLLAGEWTQPVDSKGLVIFAHGSGSSRHSPRNQYVARVLHEAGIGTLLFDLLTREEEQVDARTAHLRFNIRFLAARLTAATRWLLDMPEASEVNLGFFGSSTGAAAALVAAAELGGRVLAAVSRGGRPDLAGEALEHVSASTLFIVGGNDTPVIELNEAAFARMHCDRQLKLIPGATHLFEEAGALERVAHMAAEWFAVRLQPMEFHQS